MAKFKLTLEYDGSRYSGWQIQREERSVMGEVVGAARKVFQTERLDVYGAGRTDTGVHALAQVAHLEVDTKLTPSVVRMKLNDELPHDVNILHVEKANPRFHARFDAVARSYVYVISRRRHAFGKRYMWWIKDELDVKAMQEACPLFIGKKDFQSFSNEDPNEKSTLVVLQHLQIHEEGDLLVIHVIGSHFLWKMVRRIVGVLVEVGRGNLSKEDVRSFLAQPTNAPAQYTAPPSGLFLERVYYEKEPISKEYRILFRGN